MESWRPYTQSDNYVYQFARGFGLIMICSPSPPDAMLVSPGDRGDSESPFSAYAIGVIPNHPFFAPGRTFFSNIMAGVPTAGAHTVDCWGLARSSISMCSNNTLDIYLLSAHLSSTCNKTQTVISHMHPMLWF